MVDLLTADPWEIAARRFEALSYRTDPVAWVRRRCQEFVWSKQAEVMQSLVEHRRTAVKSCHGVGKSHIASRAAGWWLDVHPPGTAFVVTTAPTFPQVRAILWRYIRQMHRAHQLPGKVLQTEWHIDGELVAFGRKPADHDEAAFVGIHAPHVLVIIDEACGIPEGLWIAADALTTNVGCRILAIGNPDTPASHFKTVCKPGSGWNTIRISAFDSPNFTDEVVPDDLRDLLISKAWAEEKRIEWGADNPIYISKILGDFAEQAENAVVRLADVMACRLPLEIPYTPDQLLPVELGVDVGGGGDLTVIRERRGMVAGREWTSRSDRPETLAPMVLRAIAETGATAVKIDSIGIGWGLIGELRNRQRTRTRPDGEHSANIVGVNVAEKSSQPAKYANLRAQMWWEVGRQLAADRAWDLSQMENGDKTVAQLLETRWEVDTSGRIKIESKEDIRERTGGESPDHADALLLAFIKPRGNLSNVIAGMGGR